MSVIQELTAALAGRYDLDHEIGVGGMATVYLARDIKHNRRVAVKVLKPELGIVLGRERFLTEIQVTANLQHPNLLPLFDSGESGSLLFYVMPYVDGETLRDRLTRERQLPIDDALSIAVAVASALEYAHAHGVIHRDLKPENILMQAGQPIVADFGIALAVSNAGGERVTQSGMSLGTPQYMSPEQATGDRAVDARADIFSLGAVVYEMLTGEPPHAAPTAQATIAKLLTEEARSIVHLRRAVPAHVDDAVLRSLEKLPADRFTTARSFAEALQGSSPATRSRTVSKPIVPIKRRRTFAGVIVILVLVSATATFALLRFTRGDSALPNRSALAFGGNARFSQGDGGVRLALSPRGDQLAYVGTGTANPVYIKQSDQVEPRRVTGADGVNLQFSPDGQYLAFIGGSHGRTLFKVQLPGGVPVQIADSVSRYSWGDNDVVVVQRALGATTELMVIRRAGGALERLAAPDTNAGDRIYTWPHLLPGSKVALFNIARARGRSRDSVFVAAIRIADGSVTRLWIPGTNPRYLARTRHLLYTLPNGTVMAKRFDPVRLEIGKEPAVPVLENLLVRQGGAVQFTVSANGTLAYVNEGAPAQLVIADRTGRASVLIADTLRDYSVARFSHDGKRVAFQRSGQPNSNLWIYDLASGSVTPVTTPGTSYSLEWAPDGRRIAWTDQATNSTLWQPWDGSAPYTTFLDSARAVHFSPDGRYLTAIGRNMQGHQERFFAELTNPARRVPFSMRGMHLPPNVSISQFYIAPDGKWLAYAAIPDGAEEPEVYVQAYPLPSTVHRISMDGGSEPRWGATSRELFYRNRGQLWSATIENSPAFSVTRRDSMFAMNAKASPNVSLYDVSSDGQRFVMARFTGEENPAPVLVTNWFTELRERIATASRTR